jgi:hypothetical protein
MAGHHILLACHLQLKDVTPGSPLSRCTSFEALDSGRCLPGQYVLEYSISDGGSPPMWSAAYLHVTVERRWTSSFEFTIALQQRWATETVHHVTV